MRIMSLKPLDYFLYPIIQATENAITSDNQNYNARPFHNWKLKIRTSGVFFLHCMCQLPIPCTFQRQNYSTIARFNKEKTNKQTN